LITWSRLITLSLKWEKSVEVLTDPRCRIAESQDGTIKTRSAQERLEKDPVITALTELKERMLAELLLNTQSHKWERYAEEPTVPRCKTAEFLDGTTRTRFAPAKLEKDQDTTVLIEPKERTPAEEHPTFLDHQPLPNFNLRRNTISPPALIETPLTVSQPVLSL
jgi:hypothetical protein